MNYLLNTINKINESNIKNPLLESDYWIYDVDKVFHKGDFYLKVYVLNKLQNNNQPDQLTFLIEDQDISYELKAHEFSLIEEFKNINFFGVLLKLSHEPTENLDLKIISYIRDNQKYGIFNHYQTIKLEKQLETIQGSHLNFLIKHNKKYNYYPMILNNDLWLCRCGSINHESICPICGLEKDKIVIEYGNSIEEYIYKKVKEEIKYNLNVSFDENIDSYFSVLSNYNIDYNQFLSKEELEELENRYIKLQEDSLEEVNKDNLVFNLDKPFEQNIKDFLNKLELNQEYQEKVFSEEELKEIETTYNSQVKKKNKNKKRLLFSMAIVVAFAIFMFLVGFKLIDYSIANNNFKNGKYEDAIARFEKIGSFRNSENMLIESIFQKALLDFETKPAESIKILKDLSSFKEEYNNQYLELTYQYAESEFKKGKYWKAIYILEEIYPENIDFKDIKEKYYLYSYEYGKSLYSSKEYYSAYRIMNPLKNYKDADFYIDKLETTLKNMIKSVYFNYNHLKDNHIKTLSKSKNFYIVVGALENYDLSYLLFKVTFPDGTVKDIRPSTFFSYNDIPNIKYTLVEISSSLVSKMKNGTIKVQLFDDYTNLFLGEISSVLTE